MKDYKLVEGRGLAFEVNADFLGELFKPAVISFVGRHVGGVAEAFFASGFAPTFSAHLWG